MGLIITELSKRQPDLVYFAEDYQGEYPEEAPFTVSELGRKSILQPAKNPRKMKRIKMRPWRLLWNCRRAEEATGLCGIRS